MNIFCLPFFPLLIITIAECGLFSLQSNIDLAKVVNCWQKRANKEKKNVQEAVGLEKPLPDVICVDTGQNEGQAESDQQSFKDVMFYPRGNQTGGK